MKRKDYEAVDKVKAQLCFLSQVLISDRPGEDLQLSHNASYGLYLVLNDMEDQLAEALQDGRDNA